MFVGEWVYHLCMFSTTSDKSSHATRPRTNARVQRPDTCPPLPSHAITKNITKRMYARTRELVKLVASLFNPYHPLMYLPGLDAWMYLNDRRDYFPSCTVMQLCQQDGVYGSSSEVVQKKYVLHLFRYTQCYPNSNEQFGV